MTNADDFCQYAKLGQTMKIQKCLQSHSIDVNALNLYGESALSTATYHNQILSVEYLLANKADPKLRLSAGHTAIHIACRLGNVPILHMLLSLKNEENNPNLEDKHIYECLKMKDNSNLTPIHWAATQESVSKRQKMFAYLDERMPGVLDSRYNLQWFHSWAKTHPWVIDPKPSAPLSKSFNQTYRPDESSEIISLDMTPKTSINDYERTPRAPLVPTPILPTTPISSCKVTVTSIYHIPKQVSSDRFTYRAHRVHIQPTIDFPPPPSDLEDLDTPLTSKRPSHNLLSNIVPSISTPSSTDQSIKQIASSFGFDPHEQIELESVSSTDEESNYGNNLFDYLCKSTSTLNIVSPST